MKLKQFITVSENVSLVFFYVILCTQINRQYYSEAPKVAISFDNHVVFCMYLSLLISIRV